MHSPRRSGAWTIGGETPDAYGGLVVVDALSARRLAVGALQRTGSRLRHVRLVAQRAEQVCATLGPSDRELLVAAAWLHDIGYASAAAVTGLHSLDGARYLASQGWPGRLCALVANHTGARYEAEERRLADDLAQFPDEGTAVSDALTYADLTTGPDGQPVTVEQRIAEILCRYPPESPVHRGIRRASPELVTTCERAASRLAAASAG